MPASVMAENKSTAKQAKARRAFWMKQLHAWHWISAAMCLVGMLLFAITGITLNHAGDIASGPSVTSREATAPASLIEALKAEAKPGRAVVPPALADWLADAFGISAAGQIAEISRGEIYVALPRPGGDAWASVDLATGAAEYEVTDRGWISYLNDLHKGRNTGFAWRVFIDVFAVACLVFSITGLLLLQVHSQRRPFTWPAVGLGLVLPALLALVTIHL